MYRVLAWGDPGFYRNGVGGGGVWGRVEYIGSSINTFFKRNVLGISLKFTCFKRFIEFKDRDQAM